MDDKAVESVSNETKATLSTNRETVLVKWYSYLALILGALFFSGVFKDIEGPISAFDFTNLMGKFGSLGELTEGAGKLAANFRGMNGVGVRDGFLFALSLIPATIFALGVVKIIENYGGLQAAQKMLNPLLKPILGIPGISGLALIASLQSTDAGAAMTKELTDNQLLTDAERFIFVSFQYVGGAVITNFLSSGAGLFTYFSTPIYIPLLIIFVFKFVAGLLARTYIKFATK